MHVGYFILCSVIIFFFDKIFTCICNDDFCCTAYLSRPNVVCTLQILIFTGIYVFLIKHALKGEGTEHFPAF